MKLTPFTSSIFTSDGGAMFGLVPKPIWSRLIEPNESNAIPRRANGFLIELEDGRKGLLDTGCGSPSWFPEKERKHHGMPEEWPLHAALENLGVFPEEISFIVLTHAHWDHAGGLSDPERTPVFPNAEIYLHEKEWELLHSGDALLYKSYPGNIRDSLNALNDRVTKVRDDGAGILPGISLRRTGGHTEGHCSIHLENVSIPDEESPTPLAILAGDVCPTQHHLRLVFQTAYDTYPLQTRLWKTEWLQRIGEENSLLLYCHDPFAFGSWLTRNDRGQVIVERNLS